MPVCFDPPDHVIERWNDKKRYDAGIDKSKLKNSLGVVRKTLRIQQQIEPDNVAKLNPGDPNIERGIKIIDPDGKRIEYGSVDANINNCFGCGYCNIGCSYGKENVDA